jgi:hypothetical protein
MKNPPAATTKIASSMKGSLGDYADGAISRLFSRQASMRIWETGVKAA